MGSDCAEVYGGGGSSERVLGECIQTGIARGVWGRSDLVITTKIFGGGRGSLDTINSIGLSRKHLFEGLKDSLARLQLEYVDLVFCHRPDPRTPLEEVVRGMNHVIDQGMAFYWGTSEWPAAMIAEATGIADRLGLVPPYFDQSHYNMLVRQRVESDYLPLYPQLGLTVWSPLAGGKLTDRTHRSAHEGRAGDELLETVTALAEIATELRCTTAQLAVRL
jgi:aryl-alcohol dehydrogenase-like predicted oxidoreductase